MASYLILRLHTRHIKCFWRSLFTRQAVVLGMPLSIRSSPGIQGSRAVACHSISIPPPAGQTYLQVSMFAMLHGILLCRLMALPKLVTACLVLAAAQDLKERCQLTSGFLLQSSVVGSKTPPSYHCGLPHVLRCKKGACQQRILS
eukprot:1837992-Amphidinium_carterae.2